MPPAQAARGEGQAAGRGSAHIGSFTFRLGRQPIIGPIRWAWPPAPTASAPAAAAEELQQQHQQQQQCEQDDDHNHGVFLPERPSDTSPRQLTVPRCSQVADGTGDESDHRHHLTSATLATHL
jgi:hypothetical protein